MNTVRFLALRDLSGADFKKANEIVLEYNAWLREVIKGRLLASSDSSSEALLKEAASIMGKTQEMLHLFPAALVPLRDDMRTIQNCVLAVLQESVNKAHYSPCPHASERFIQSWERIRSQVPADS